MIFCFYFWKGQRWEQTASSLFGLDDAHHKYVYPICVRAFYFHCYERDEEGGGGGLNTDISYFTPGAFFLPPHLSLTSSQLLIHRLPSPPSNHLIAVTPFFNPFLLSSLPALSHISSIHHPLFHPSCYSSSPTPPPPHPQLSTFIFERRGDESSFSSSYQSDASHTPYLSHSFRQFFSMLWNVHLRDLAAGDQSESCASQLFFSLSHRNVSTRRVLCSNVVCACAYVPFETLILCSFFFPRRRRRRPPFLPSLFFFLSFLSFS